MFELRRLKICSVMAFLTLLVIPWEASAQCRIGSGPDHGDGVPYCNDLAPARQAPRPKEAVDVYVSVAAHPDANDVWAIWNVREVQGGQTFAESAVLADCAKIMGEGCSIADSVINGSMAIGRDQRGFIFNGWGATAETAKKQLFQVCVAEFPCTMLHVFTAKPWVEYTDVAGFDELKRYRPNSRGVKGRWGAVVMAAADNARWAATAWVSSGHSTSADAQKAAQDKCSADVGSRCPYFTLNKDGVMAVYWDEHGKLYALDERNSKDANPAVRASCKRNGVTCDVIKLFDAKKPGLEIVDAAISKK